MNEFVRTDDYIYINTPYAEAYVAKELFSEEDTPSSIATQYGDGFKLIGDFNMRFFDNENQNRESRPLRTFNYPNAIITFPSSYSIEKIALNEYMEPEPYYIFKYEFGDIMMEADAIKSSNNCTKFLAMITSGKIPNTIPYDKFIQIWETNFDINGVNSGVPSVTLQMIWAEMCRSRKDITIPFRKEYGTGKTDPTHYIQTNMDNVAAATSVFSGIAFQRTTEKLASSINMTKNNVEQRRSPIEKVLSM